MVRKHGWDWPLHGFQVAAIAVFFSLMAMFYIFLAPFLGSKAFQYAAFASYSILAATVILLYIRCAAINPADPGAIASQAQKDNEKDRCMRIPLPFFFVWFLKDDRYLRKGSEFLGADEDILFCTLCNTEVRKFSKHCRTCDKCVDGFDHHCRWLNNCVGRKNYTTFFALMTASLILLIMEWAIGAAVIARCFANNGATKHQIVNKLGDGFPVAAFATIVAVSTAVALVGSIPLLELLFFHLILIRKGLTTYDYVVAMRTQNEEQPKPSEEDAPTSPNSPYKYKGAWCTPPREFVKHGDEITPHLELGEISPSEVDTTATSKLDSKSIKINPCNLAKLNPIQVARAVSKARKKSSVMRALNRDNASEAGNISTNNSHTKTKSRGYDMFEEFDSSRDSDGCCALPAKADYDQYQGPLHLPPHK